MTKTRLEAFSDGVLAIIITIMVLEMKVPHGHEVSELKPLLPVFMSYVLSFIYIGIYWNNHHHLLHAVRGINGKVMWANMHLLFWLSLIPFASGWMGENHFTEWPVALYGFILLMCSIAYYILSQTFVKLHGEGSVLAQAIGRDKKGLFSTLLNLVAIPLAFVNPWISFYLYSVVAIMWFMPDKRIEKELEHSRDD